jgi:hypothetical protein
MNLHGKFVQNSRHEGIARKPKFTSEEVVKHDDFIDFRSGNLLVEGSTTVSSRKESSHLVFPDKIVVTLDSPKTKDGGNDFERFAEMRSLESASTSTRSSFSDLISPSSRFSDSGAAAGAELPS